MSSLTPYPEYKDSGVEWLGHIPMEWDVNRIKLSVESAKNGIWGEDPNGDSRDVWCVRVADFDRPHLSVSTSNRTLRAVTKDDLANRSILQGDLLLEKSGGGEKNPVGFVVHFDHQDTAVCSNFVARVRLQRGMDPRFWTYVHAATYNVRLTQRSIKQTSGIQNLDQTSYFNEYAPFPPPEVQAAIADFLDQETCQIDDMIAKQEQLIELLAEKRQAIITQAVTKGLDPSTPTKPSGIPWVGDTPSHWSKIKLSWVASFLNGDRGSNYPSREEFQNDGVPFINAGHLTDDGIDMNSMNFITSRKYARMGGAKVQNDDILYCLRGSLGKHTLVTNLNEGALASSLVAIRVFQRKRISPAYLELLFKSPSAASQLAIIASGSAQPNMSVENLRDFTFIIPPLLEQEQIIASVRKDRVRIDRIGAAAKTMIQRLRERRSALISAAVTGKIDVRGEVA